MRVVEIFQTLQGEGMLVGTPSVFVRLAGCPFRCRWCDTAYAWDYTAGEDLDPAQIVEQVGERRCRFVVLTGGEPMAASDLSVRPGLVELTQRLRAVGKHITIETAGALFVPDLACDLMSISPKLSNAASGTHQSGWLDIENVRRLTGAYPYQLKFVVESSDDVPEVQRVLGTLGDIAPECVMLMPQAKTREELLSRSPIVAEACKRTGLRFGPRLHIELWGQQRGT
jgi:7-carboxy-7-deazaguanine synthase